MKEHYQKPVLEMLKDKYKVDGDNLYSVIDKIANALATEYYNNNGYSITQMIENIFLEELDNENVKVTFESAVSVSIAYTLMIKMGLLVSDHFEHEYFSKSLILITPATISLLGTAVSEQTKQVFREIAKTIAKEERSVQNEQSNLQTRGRLPDPKSTITGTRRLQVGQILEDEKSTSVRISHPIIQPSTTQRKTVPTFSGDRQDSQPTIGTNNDRAQAKHNAPDQINGNWFIIH